MRNSRNNLDVLIKLCEANDCDLEINKNMIGNKILIKSCIKQYGSLEDTPEEIVESIIDEKLLDNIFDYLRPVVSYLSKKQPVFSMSPMLTVLFPNIKNGIIDDYDVTHFSLFSENTVDCTKEKFLTSLRKNYNSATLCRLYELYETGVITAEDIVNSGLHLIYAVCERCIAQSV